MKLKIIQLLLTLITSLNSFGQTNEIDGEYSYSSDFYYESINLRANGQFVWNVNGHSYKLSLTGNWQKRGDSIFLDSSPQKDKLIVWESRPTNSKIFTFYVTDKMKYPINYHLFGITQNNDTLLRSNQFQKTTLKENLKAFYLIDSKGLYSPTYFIKGSHANRFDILFENHRVFENESWLIKDGEIIPKGLDGKIQNYKLVKP